MLPAIQTLVALALALAALVADRSILERYEALRQAYLRAGTPAEKLEIHRKMTRIDLSRAFGRREAEPTPAAPVAASERPPRERPARDLAPAEALRALEELRAEGIVDWSGRWGTRVQLSVPIDGVAFRYHGRRDVDRQLYPVDPRTALAIVRLARWARARGVREIVHRGLAGKDAESRHTKGLALDIGGMWGTDPASGEGFDHDVLRDWGLAEPAEAGFRLDRASPAGRFFAELYDFLAAEFRDGPGDRPTAVGQASYILTPDHPDPDLADDHLDHIHVELEPARATTDR